MKTRPHSLYRPWGKLIGVFVAAIAATAHSQDQPEGEQTCERVSGPGTESWLFSYYSSFDEGSAAGYRKIRMDGRPFRDATPLSKGLSDTADENTYVDAFSQTLVHQVTDIYIPFEGTEVALAIRRSAAPQTWATVGSILPDARPDRPFGAGWRSGFGASVELVEPIKSSDNGANPQLDFEKASYAYVTDEDGASYRFLALPYASGGPIFIYMPFDGNDKREGEVSLGLVNGVYILSKKHGTLVKYSGSQSQFAMGFGTPIGPGVMPPVHPVARHTYSRIAEVVLGSGEVMTYTATSVTFRGKTITMVGGDKVTSVTDPKGNTTTFSYGSVNDATVLTSVTKPDGAVTTYGYTGSQEADQTPRAPGDFTPPTVFKTLQINSITDPRGNGYFIAYEPDETKNNWMLSTYYSGTYKCVGSPQLITSVGLPGGGGASFQRVGSMTLGSLDGSLKIIGTHHLSVGDASGANWGYNFGGVKVTRLMEWVPFSTVLFPRQQDIPFYVSFGTMQISSAGGGISAVFNELGYLQSYHDINYAGAFQFNYNGAGDVTSQMNPAGHQTTFTYGDNHKIRTITDAEGRVTDRTLGAHGRTERETIKTPTGDEISVTDYYYGNFSMPTVPTQKSVRKSATDPGWAVDLVTEYALDAAGNIVMEKVGPPGNQRISYSTYDANNNKTSSTDANGNATGFAYDACNRLTLVDPPGPGAKGMYYDAYGNKVKEIDERGIATLWEYDARNRPIKEVRDMNANGVIDEPDLVTTTTYNAVGSKTSVTTPNGQTTQFQYDGIQRLVKTIDPLAGETTFEYGANSGGLQFGDGFKPTRVINPRGFETLTAYNPSMVPTEVKSQYATDGGAQPLYSITKLEYDKVGNVLKEIDPLNRETTHVYDAHNRKISTTWPDGSAVQALYTFSGLPWKSVDELGKDTLTEFDDAGRPVKLSSPEVDNGAGVTARAVTQTEYDPAGNVIETINPLGRSWAFEYDERNRKVKEIRPGAGSPTLESEYDAVGNVTKVIDARGAETETIYDAANRATEIKQPLVAVYGSGTSRPTTLSEYDKNGNMVKLTDPNGRETNNTYDALNRLITTTDAEGIVVENEYDEAGNKTAVIDGKEQRTEFTYDGLNRNTAITDAANKSTTFEFDAINKMARVDAKGQRTEYGYDSRNRLTTVSYTGRTQDNRSYAYDATGNLLAVTEPHVSKAGKADVAYSYDALKRQLTETSGGLTHVYKYDLAGNRVFCLYGGLSVPLVSAYDEQNRLGTLTQGALVTVYTYDLNGNNLAKTLPNGDKSVSVFDAANRTASLTGASGINAPLYGYAYGYDAAGNVRQVAETYANTALNRVVTNTYDAINRLTQEAVTGSGAATTAFAYDDANNRSSMSKGGVNTSYSYNAVNQLTGFTSGTNAVSFGYDDNGNRLTRNVGAATGFFEWDYENRLSSYAIQGNQTKLEFLYDYRTRRVETANRTFPSNILRYRDKHVFSGGVEARELRDGASSVDYVRGSDWGGGVGGILYTLRGGVPSFTHYNRRGDVTAKTDGTGVVTYQSTYEAFGKRVTETGATADRQKSNTKDEDIPGYANEGFRFRDLETGTFISRDPAGFVDGPNLYAYVRQNPWTKFDPEGLSEVSIWDSLAPATAAAARGGQSPWGGERGAVAASRQFQGMHAGAVAVAAAPYAATLAGGAAVVAGAEAPAVAAAVTTRAVGTALTHPVATTAAVEAVTVGAVVYAETGDVGAAVSSAMLSGVNSYANGAGGKPTASAKDTKAQTEAQVAKTGPYAHLEDPPTVGPGKLFTPAQKKNIVGENVAANEGVPKSDLSGTVGVAAQKSVKGVTPPPNEVQVDHIVPRSKGGSNSYSNAQVLTREENRKKSDN